MKNIHTIIKTLAIAFAIFIILNIFNLVVLAFTLFTGINIFGNSKQGELEVQETKKYEDVKGLDIDIKNADLYILKGNDFRVEVQSHEDKLSINKKGTTLKIEEKTKYFWENTYKIVIKVYVPTFEKLSNIEIDAGAGNIEIENITVENAEIDQGAGKFKVTDSYFSRTKIDGGAGTLEVKNSNLGKLSLDSGVGNITMEDLVLSSSEIDSGIGKISLNFKTRDDYSIYAEKGIGSIRIDGKSHDNNLTYGSGPNLIEIDGGIGNIEVTFD